MNSFRANVAGFGTICMEFDRWARRVVITLMAIVVAAVAILGSVVLFKLTSGTVRHPEVISMEHRPALTVDCSGAPSQFRPCPSETLCRRVRQFAMPIRRRWST